MVYIPIFIYWLYCGLKARAIFYFSAANPGIRYGGLIGSSKKQILDLIPEKYLPVSVFIQNGTSESQVFENVENAGLSYPLIAKPDVGERGWHVAFIRNSKDMSDYLDHINQDFILQEYLDMPFEAGIFYYRFPDKEYGTVSSVVVKEMLSITGDGQSTFLQLIYQKPRARFQLKKLEKKFENELDVVLLAGETRLLEPIGNHSRGTAFLNGNSLINQNLIDVFDKLSKQIDGFYYGRFDVRCKDEHALYSGDFKIMELNGAASEPAHIYAPDYPLVKGYRSLFHHWRVLYKISRINHRKGIKYMSFRTGLYAIKHSRLFG